MWVAQQAIDAGDVEGQKTLNKKQGSENFGQKFQLLLFGRLLLGLYGSSVLRFQPVDAVN